MRLLVFLAICSLAGVAHADVQAVLVASADGGPFVRGPIQARLGEAVVVRVALIDGSRALSDVPAELGRRVRVSGPLPAGLSIAWVRIEPEREHVDTPPPNPGIASFSNAVLTGPDRGTWLGLDALEYREALARGPGVEVAADRVTLRGAHPTDPAFDVNGGAGSMWLAARVTMPDGTVLRTSGLRTSGLETGGLEMGGPVDVDQFGLRAEVLRVSFRTGDDYLGWLATYFNVPFVFGSTSIQVERYTGTDCADALVGGLRRAGHEVPYVSVAGLRRVASPRTDAFVLDETGVHDATGLPMSLVWGEDIAPGDLVTIDYLGPGDDALLPRPWDHIGALVRDDGDGVLDHGDVLRHMGNLGLVDEPLSAHGRTRLRVHRFR